MKSKRTHIITLLVIFTLFVVGSFISNLTQNNDFIPLFWIIFTLLFFPVLFRLINLHLYGRPCKWCFLLRANGAKDIDEWGKSK